MKDNDTWEDETGDVLYLGKGRFILKAFKNVWFNPDGTEINPLDKRPLRPNAAGKYICTTCNINTDCEECPVCRRILPKRLGQGPSIKPGWKW